MVKRKGIAYLLDAFIGVMVLVIFTIGTFSVTDNSNWGEYEDKIAAQDLGYTLKETGHLNDFVSRGETGSLQTAVSTVSERSFEVSGEVGNAPYSTDIGFHVDPDQIHVNNLTQISPGDRCYDELSTLREEEDISSVPILRTNTTGLESQHNTRLYVGNDPNYQPSDDPLSYDSLWVDDGVECDFPGIDRPYRPGDIFLWGDSGDPAAENYVFEQVYINTSSTISEGDWNGRIEVHEASQIKRFKDAFSREVSGMNPRVKLDTFNFSDSIESYDVLVFREKDSLQAAADSGNRERVKEYLRQNSVIFLANLGKSNLQDGTLLNELGFDWVEASASGSTSSISFSESTASIKTQENFFGMQGEKDQVSLDPGGKIKSDNTGAVSSSKLVYYTNYGYDKLSQKVENNSMDPVNSEPAGAPETDCESSQPNNYMTRGEFTFPTETGSEEYTVLNTLVGDSCNNRLLNIDRDRDGDFADSNEGPYLDTERLEVVQKTYRANIVSAADVSFLFQGNAKVETVNYATFEQKEGEVARASYEQNYEVEDRKLLASTIYWLAEPYRFGMESEDYVSTTLVGSEQDTTKAYTLKLRWSR